MRFGAGGFRTRSEATRIVYTRIEQAIGGKVSRFDYVKYDEQSIQDQMFVKQVCEKLADMIEAQGPGRATALALTKLEECYTWLGKAIRDNQIKRNGEAQLQEERTNS